MDSEKPYFLSFGDYHQAPGASCSILYILVLSLVLFMHTTRISRLLSCKRLNDIAWSQLTSVVKRRRRLDDITTADIADFLNNPPLPQEKTNRDVRSIWSSARKSLQHLSCSIALEGSEVSLIHDDITVSARQKKLVRKLLKEARDQRRLTSLLEAQDQGRSFHLISQSPSSSHWLSAGAFTSFLDFRFAIRALLNLLQAFGPYEFLCIHNIIMYHVIKTQ